MNYPIETLIDPQAQVIDKSSSTRALKLIRRALLSHLAILTQTKRDSFEVLFQEENYPTEFNSTCQLVDDLELYLQTRSHDPKS